MGGIGAQPLCACYKEYQEFHKVVELKDTGLVVYCHTTRREDVIQDGLVGSAISTSQDVFILHNTKDVKITSADLIPALEKNDISCPRCRQLFEHAQELLQKVPLIDKKNVMGICDHCRLKAQFNNKTCSECEEIVKKFLSAKSEQKEDTKNFIKIWLSKMKHLLKDAVTSDKPKPSRTRAYSELQIDRLCQYSPRSTREPVVKQMFPAETHKSDTNLHKEMTDAMLKEQHKLDKSVIFTEPVEPLETPLTVAPYGGENINMVRPGPMIDGSNATFVEPPLKGYRGKQDDISEYYDDSNIRDADVKGEIKKNHDLSLRNMMRPDKEAEDPYPISRRSDKYEIPKIAPWERPEPESAMDVKIANKKHMTTLESESREIRPLSRRPEKSISQTSQKSLREYQRKKDHISETYVESTTDAKEATKRKHDLNLKNMMVPEKETRDQQYTVEKIEHGNLKKATYDSDIPKKVVKREDRYLTDDEIKFQRSVSKFNHETEKPGQRDIKTIKSKKPIQFEEPSENILHKQFSYFFPKGKEREAKKPKLGARSSQLIKNTQEKLRQQDEEKRKKKLEEDETKRFAREEKKRLAEEKKKTVEEQKKLSEEIQRKKHTEEELENKLVTEKEKKRLDEDKRQEETESKTKKGKEKGGSVPESELKGKLYEETEKAKKDMKPKPETKEKIDKGADKEKKGLKSKTQPSDKIDKEAEKKQKEEKSKTAAKDKIDKEMEKKQKEETSKSGPKDKIDKEAEKKQKEEKSKTAAKDKVDKEVEKKQKEETSKTGPKDKIDKEAEKKQKEEKSKTAAKDKVDKEVEKKQKEETSKTGPKDIIDKEAEKKQKEEEKYAHKQELQKEREEKDKAKQVEQTRKEKEASSSKKQDSSKESSKKNLESTKEKEKQSKKLEDSAKQKPEPSTEIEDPSKIKQQSSKQIKEGSKKLQDVSKEKEELSSKKQAPSKEVEEPKRDLIKEKEGPPKVKEKSSSIREDKSKTNEESNEDTSKGQNASKKAKDDTDEHQFKKLQAESAKQKEEDLKKKKQGDAETLKARELADKKAKDEDERKSKIVSEAKAATKPEPKLPSVEQKDKPEDAKSASKKEKEGIDELQLKKTQAELTKQKEEDLKKKKQNEDEAQKARELADKKTRDEGDRKLQIASEAKAVPKPEPKQRSVQQKDKADESTEDAKGGSRKAKEGKDELQLKKVQTELAKQKEEDLKKIKQNEAEAQKVRELADKKARDEGEGKSKIVSEAKAVHKPEAKRRSVDQKDKIAESTEDAKGASKKAKDVMDVLEFKKLQAELAKRKEEDLKLKKQNEAEAERARELADKKAREEGERKLKEVREAKAVPKPEPKRRSVEQKDKPEESTMKELKIKEIKMRKPSPDDLILQLVKIRQTAIVQKMRTRPCNVDPALILLHKGHQKSGLFSSACDLCNDSELEIDVESYDNKIHFKSPIEEVIIGEKIFKYKPPTHEKTEQEVVPMLFKSIFQEETATLPLKEIVNIIPEVVAPEKKPILATLLPKKDTKGEQVELEPGKGIIRYALSDRTFIDKGWTMLPTEKVVRKMNVYRMRPAHPEFDWFEHNKNKRLMTYDTGEKLAEFDDNGRGRWYYRSGRLALDYYDAEETNAQQRFVVYSSGEPDERGRTHPFTILATFDYLGNGIVFDHAGKIRLKYNQTEGVVLDRGIGPVSHWKWHTLNDPPVLQQVMIDTQMAHKDPEIIKLGSPADFKSRPDNEEMLAIEFDNFIKEKSKKLSQKFKPFQIKMKALKINEHFSLKVLDQATIYLIYRDGSTNLKLNIGMVLDHQEIVDTDTAEVGEVSNNLERFPARTDSLAGLQRSVAYAQRYERQRTERERRLRPAVEPCASADQITAAASPPLRPPLRTMPAGSTSSAGYCKCRKPTNNLYYNTRLL